MAQLSRFCFVPKEDRGTRTLRVCSLLSGMKGKPPFVLQRVSIQPRARYFSGGVNEAGKEGFHKEEFNVWNLTTVWTKPIGNTIA